MPLVAIHTLGCKLNQLESEALADAFVRSGFSLCEWGDDNQQSDAPDIIIINTCTVTSRSDQKARRIIRKALRDFPSACVIVTGCYARLESEAILALEEVDSGGSRRLFAIGEKAALLALINIAALSGVEPQPSRFSGEGSPLVQSIQHSVARFVAAVCEGQRTSFSLGSGRTAAEKAFAFTPQQFSFHTRAFLKIQDGCDNHCTYCRIRLARGPSISMDAAAVLAELQALEAAGYWEAVLTGVNISLYREESGVANFAGLLEYLLAGTNSIGIRISSLEPQGIDEQLAAVLSHKRIRPSFHLSVQSGSEKVLAKMGRSYSGQTVEQAARLLRRAQQNPFLACDIITGFPGETEVEFSETIELCRRIGFAWIHAFPYSKRPGTPAYDWPQTVSEQEAARRVEMLTSLAHEGRRAYAESCVGSDRDAVVESGGLSDSEKKAKFTLMREHYCRGLSDNYLKLMIRYNGDTPPPPGTVLRCRIQSTCDGTVYDSQADEITE